MTIMTQDGYVAVIEYDPDLDTFAGRILNLSSPVTFYGRTPDELRKELATSIRTYLEVCREQGIEPEKPYSGRFNVRLSPELHRKAALAASLSGKSLNALVSDAVAKETESVIETNSEPRSGACARTIAVKLSEELQNAIAVEAMFSRCNDAAICKAFDNTVEAHGFNVIQHALIDWLILCLMRMHDAKSGDKASVAHLFELLDNQGVFHLIRQSGLHRCAEAIDRAREGYRRLPSDKIETLRKYRHEHLGHSLFDMPRQPAPRYGFVFDLLAETAPIVADLRLGVTDHDIDLEEMHKVWTNRADTFWRRAAGEYHPSPSTLR